MVSISYSLFYQFLQGLIEYINTRLNFKSEEDTAELTRADIIRFIQSEKIKLRGVNLHGLDLSKLVRYTLILKYHLSLSIFFLN